MEDPLQNLEIDIHSYDISREASIYFDTTGTRCWTKAWFNGREKGEKSIEKGRKPYPYTDIIRMWSIGDWMVLCYNGGAEEKNPIARMYVL